MFGFHGGGGHGGGGHHGGGGRGGGFRRGGGVGFLYGYPFVDSSIEEEDMFFVDDGSDHPAMPIMTRTVTRPSSRYLLKG